MIAKHRSLLHRLTAARGVLPEEVARTCDPTVRAISAQPTPSGGVAHVTIRYRHVDLVIASVDGKLLADDLQCARGGVDTSVYREPLTGC